MVLRRSDSAGWKYIEQVEHIAVQKLTHCATSLVAGRGLMVIVRCELAVYCMPLVVLSLSRSSGRYALSEVLIRVKAQSNSHGPSIGVCFNAVKGADGGGESLGVDLDSRAPVMVWRSVMR